MKASELSVLLVEDDYDHMEFLEKVCKKVGLERYDKAINETAALECRYWFVIRR